MVDYSSLENYRTERYRGFESLSLRTPGKTRHEALKADGGQADRGKEGNMRK